VLDVDLVESTRTCVRWLYRGCARAGRSSQDGHLQATVAAPDTISGDEVGVSRPRSRISGA
jgi:hypothetical protein